MRSSLALASVAALASATSLDVSGYKRQDLGYSAINAPTDKCPTFIQHSIYKEVNQNNFDPARCIRDCEETTAYNKQYLNSRASCRFVNTYILLKDGYSQGQVCSMYTASWGKDVATNVGYTDHEGHKFTICDSYTYSNITNPGVPGKDCVGGNTPPVYSSSAQPPVYSSSAKPPVYSSSAKPPTYPSQSSGFTTLTSKSSTSSKASTTSQAPTTTSKASTTSQAPSTSSASTTTSAPGGNNGGNNGGSFQCTGLLSIPQCCQTNVLGVAGLTCSPPNSPSNVFGSSAEFSAICAQSGATANCCAIPVAGQGLICQDVAAPGATPSSATTTNAPAPTNAPSSSAPTTGAPAPTTTAPGGNNGGNNGGNTGSFQCTGLLSIPECCQTNVLGVAGLTCSPPNSPSNVFASMAEFSSICAQSGATANCCAIPVAGQGLVCQDVAAPGATPSSATTVPSTPAPTTAPGGNNGGNNGGSTGSFQCTGLLSSPQCCDTNVLGAAGLSCEPPTTPSSIFASKDQFRANCAASGTTASCCLLPVLGQGLVCEDV